MRGRRTIMYSWSADSMIYTRVLYHVLFTDASMCVRQMMTTTVVCVCTKRVCIKSEVYKSRENVSTCTSQLVRRSEIPRMQPTKPCSAITSALAHTLLGEEGRVK